MAPAGLSEPSPSTDRFRRVARGSYSQSFLKTDSVSLILGNRTESSNNPINRVIDWRPALHIVYGAMRETETARAAGGAAICGRGRQAARDRRGPVCRSAKNQEPRGAAQHGKSIPKHQGPEISPVQQQISVLVISSLSFLVRGLARQAWLRLWKIASGGETGFFEFWATLGNFVTRLESTKAQCDLALAQRLRREMAANPRRAQNTLDGRVQTSSFEHQTSKHAVTFNQNTLLCNWPPVVDNQIDHESTKVRKHENGDDRVALSFNVGRSTTSRR
jgi:hypothetical protein